MTNPRTRVYRLLRHSCGLTHHESKHIIETHLLHLGEWRNVLYRGLRKEKEEWSQNAEATAAMVMAQEPSEAGKMILDILWPNRDEEPEAPFVVASMAASIYADTHSLNPTQRRVLWLPIEKILKHEQRRAIDAWDDRMLNLYLKIKKVI